MNKDNKINDVNIFGHKATNLCLLREINVNPTLNTRTTIEFYLNN